MKALYDVTAPIPSLGALPGDKVLVEPSSPHSPLIVFREFDRNRLPLVLDHIDQELELVTMEGEGAVSVQRLEATNA